MIHLTVFQGLVAVVVFIAAMTDLKSRKIPNSLTLAGVLAGLASHALVSGTSGLATSAEGMLVGFGVYFALYCLRAMGAGDVKLMAAVGAIVGPEGWIAVFLASAIAGGVLALGLLIVKKRLHTTLWNTAFLVNELLHFRAPFQRRSQLDVKDPRALNLPHGVAIAAGTAVCLLMAKIS